MNKAADLAGLGISTYEEVEKILPSGYAPLLNREVTVSVWPKQLKEICAKKNIHVLE